MDLTMTFPRVLVFVTNAVSIMKVVETGIFNLVRIRRIIGAATYK